MNRYFALMAFVLLLAACGQRGPLYLQTQPITPSPITPSSPLSQQYHE